MKAKNNSNPTFWKLLWFFFKISIFSFGGGNAMFSIIKSYCVDKYHWIKNEDIDDILIITNSIPGASAIEGIAYISFLLLKSKWKAGLVTFLSMLPHTLIFFLIFYIGNKYVPTKYLSIIYVAVIPVIIILLINMAIRYIKYKKNGIPITIHWIIFIVTFAFTFFVPTPFNIPIFIIIFFIICIFIWNKLNKKKNKNKDGDK